MSKLFRINAIAIVITLVLYLTFWLGIMAQVLLGGLQIICAIVIALNYKRLSPQVKVLFLTYSVLTISVVTAFGINNEFFYVLWLGSGVLAFFFLYITYLIKMKVS